MRCVWGSSSKMRCTVVAIGILNDPTRVDHYYAAAYRSILDTRRMLKKSPKRYDQFIEQLIYYNGCSTIDGVTGPAHGFIANVGAIGAEISIEEHRIFICTKLGAKIDIMTPHWTHLQACIRETCRHTVIRRLQQRNHDEKLQGRQDLSDIPALVDVNATMALARSRKKDRSKAGTSSDVVPCASTHAEAAPEICEPAAKRKKYTAVDAKQGSTEDVNYCVPCELSYQEKRQMHTIIAGSIRSPNRLKHSGIITDDKCSHPECKGARVDALHIFWHCHPWAKA